ncbi:MAG: hypothetical protein ACI4M3_09455 [Acutalibacteraceae bacterium]
MISKKITKLIVSLMVSVVLCMTCAAVYAVAAESQRPTVQAVDYDDDYDYYYDDDYSDSTHNEPKNMGKIILFSAIFAVVCGGVSVVAVYLRYKNNGKSEPYPYNNKSTLSLSESSDLLVDTRVTSVKINKD